MGHAQPQDAYTGEYSLNIPADAGFGNNFNLVTFPDHAPQTQQAEQYDVSLLQQQRLHEQQQQQLLLQQHQQQLLQQQQAQQRIQPQRFQPKAQPQRFQPTKQTVQPQRFQQQPAAQPQRFQPAQQPQRFQQPAQSQRFQQSAQPERFQAVPQSQRFQQEPRQQQAQPQVQQTPQLQAATRPSTDAGRFTESRRLEPQHQGGFSNFPARTAARAGTSGERNSAPSFAARPALTSFRPSPTSPPRQSVVEPENIEVDYDYDSELSRYQLFKLRQKAKLAAEKRKK